MTSVIAHRGASAVRRENTVDAFLEARRRGADGVELDVRRGADGALVVHHDAALPRGGLIVNMHVSELPEDVPLLDAALDACEGMTVNVEVKNLPMEADFDPDEAVSVAVAGVLAERGDPSRFLVSSFSLAALDAVRAAEPSLPIAWLTLPQFDQLLALETAAEHGAQALNPHHRAVTAELVAAATAAGLAVNAWTVDDPDRMRELADLGVSAIITNVPDIAVEALAAWR